MAVWKLVPWVHALVFPVACIGCDAPGSALCSRCGPPVGERTVEAVANVAVTAAGSYAGSLRRAVVAMKQGERAYLEPLARLLADLAPAVGIPLVPLPTTARRRAARGFDQSVELARRAAVARGVPLCDLLIKHGAPQRGRDRAARLQHAGGGFRLRGGIALPPAAIAVDDVCTTGATLAAGIATLRSAGVAVVGAIVVARTPAGRNSRPSSAVMAHGPRRRQGASHVKAIWNQTVIAESDATEVVEGNHYFPAHAIKREYFRDSSTHTTCPWKGVASYYTLEVDGKANPDAAWYYPAPKDAAKNIEGHVAFWKGVEVRA